MLINDLTLKLFYEIQCQLSIGNKGPTNLFKYAECCQDIAQRPKNVTRMKTISKRYAEKSVAATATVTTPIPVKKAIISTIIM